MFRYALGLSSIALLGHKEGKTRQKIKAKVKQKQANTFLPIFAPILFIAKTKEMFFIPTNFYFSHCLHMLVCV
jgi:hypothetical protein